MSEQPKPNVAYSLIAIHGIVTRALEVSIERSETFARSGYPDDSIRQGFLDYLRTLVSVLRAHHLSEDELGFPYFRDQLPEAPFDDLMADHNKMEALLEEIEVAIEGVVAVPMAGGSLADLNRALGTLRTLWQPHIGTEENYLAPETLGPMLPAEEHLRLIKLFAEFSQQHAGTDFLVVPFMLYNLPPEPRAMMAAAMPPVVMQQLVPVAWKEKWAPMKPFLLA